MDWLSSFFFLAVQAMKTYERYVDFPVEIITKQATVHLFWGHYAYEQRIERQSADTVQQQEQEINHCKEYTRSAALIIITLRYWDRSKCSNK